MNILVIKENQFIETAWSGGSTSQLYIYPKGASLENRDFDFRISSAKIEVEVSNFTSFYGYDRALMVLKGELEIFHEGHYSKKLNQFEIDNFSGDWNTTSKGKVTDFNLIVRNGIQGALKYISLQEEYIKIDCNLFQPLSKLGYFVISGELKIQINNLVYSCQQGELFMIEMIEDYSEKVVEIFGTSEVVEILIFNV